jgi:hypothetical protein
MLDALSGVEIELVLDDMNRIELASVLAYALGAHAVGEITISKVPVPQLRGRVPDRDVATATIAAMKAIAAKHEAQLTLVSPDGAHFLLEHRAARLSDGEGLVCRLLHDNTIDGGERVCELVTAPMRGQALRNRLGRILQALRERARYHFTEATALHVHVEHKVLAHPRHLQRLIALYAEAEPQLRTRLQTPSGLQRAKPLPPAVLNWRSTSDSWDQARAELAPHVPERDHALNLHNLVTNDADKPTIELKIAASTDDIDDVMEARAAFIELITRAVA